MVVRKTGEASYEIKDARDTTEPPSSLKRVNAKDIVLFHRRTLAAEEDVPIAPMIDVGQLAGEGLQPMMQSPAPEQMKAPVVEVGPLVLPDQPSMDCDIREQGDRAQAPVAPSEESVSEQQILAPEEEKDQSEDRPKKRGRRAVQGPQHVDPTCWRRICQYRYRDGSHQYLVEWERPRDPGQDASKRRSTRSTNQTWVDLSDCSHRDQFEFIRAFNENEGLEVQVPFVNASTVHAQLLLSESQVGSDRATLGARVVRYTTCPLQPVYLLWDGDSFSGT